MLCVVLGRRQAFNQDKPGNERGMDAHMDAAPKKILPKKSLLIVEEQLLLAMQLEEQLEDASYRVLDLAVRHQEALASA
jgi:hypothetical protein